MKGGKHAKWFWNGKDIRYQHKDRLELVVDLCTYHLEPCYIAWLNPSRLDRINGLDTVFRFFAQIRNFVFHVDGKILNRRVLGQVIIDA